VGIVAVLATLPLGGWPALAGEKENKTDERAEPAPTLTPAPAPTEPAAPPPPAPAPAPPAAAPPTVPTVSARLPHAESPTAEASAMAIARKCL